MFVDPISWFFNSNGSQSRRRVYAFDENQRLDAHGRRPYRWLNNACEHATQASTLIKGRGCLVPRRCIAQPCAYNARRHVIPRAREYWDICTLDLRTPLRSLNHTANWEVHPGEINEAPLQMNSWAAPSFARLWPLSRYIHVPYIPLGEKEKEREAEKGREIATWSELVLLLKKEFFFIAKNKYR